MKIYIVLYVSCSEMGFASPKILGLFNTEREANAFRKEKCVEISSYHKIFVLSGLLSKEDKQIEPNIPIDVIDGYTVA